MLPQSTFKIWGIEDTISDNFFQFEYKASHKNWKIQSESIYKLNKLICEFHGIRNFKYISQKDKQVISNGLFDEQILNRIHNFPNVSCIGSINIINYTSNTSKLTSLSDLQYGIEGLRHLYRNYRFYKKVYPDKVYSIIYKWNKYMEKRADLFWENRYINHELLKKRSREFVDFHINIFPEIAYMRRQIKTLIINPRIDQSIEDFTRWVKNNQSFLSEWNETIIFIKHHRISHFTYPQNFKIRQNHFKAIPFDLLSILPIEIIIFAVDNLTVLSTASSILALGKNIVLKMPLSEIEKKDYLLMIKQLNRKSELQIIN
jgi:hypothetical protein